jgi:methyl-accepting chemotaxis protein
MAVKIAKKINFAENCIQKAHAATQDEHSVVLDWLKRNVASLHTVQYDIANIKELADKIVNSISSVTKAIGTYEDMTKDIDKIASNIHMISLNASIEAARAGEYGRSFAVVAEAIRNLAGETQKETLKITMASKEARSAMESVAKTISGIGDDIAQAHDSVSKIAEDTQSLLRAEDKTDFALKDSPAAVQ